jgi:hypothetical protein
MQNTLAVFLCSHFNGELKTYHVLAALIIEKFQNNDL